MKRSLQISLCAAGLLGLAAAAGAQCGDSSTTSSNSLASQNSSNWSQNSREQSMNARNSRTDIVDTAVVAGSFKTLAAALEAANLVDALKADGPFTVFAPTDDAFAKLPKGTLEELLKPENRSVLKSILLYHVVEGDVRAEKVVSMDAAPSLLGQRIEITSRGGKVMVDKATVSKADIVCSNGVIHVIDSVIMPSMKDIVETAVDAGSFSTLAEAINAAGLVSTLQGDGPFTVFAPTDEAFAKLPAGTLDNLLKPENREMLIAVLTYHVVPGRVYADQAIKAGRATTVQGSPVRITSRGGTVMVNGAKVITPDIDATNGVIHVIDAVILPE